MKNLPKKADSEKISGEKFWEKEFITEDEEVAFFRSRELYKTAPLTSPFWDAAKEAAVKHSLTPDFPIGIIAVKNNEVVAEAGNGNGYHQKNENTEGHKDGCVRKYLRQEAKNAGYAIPKGLSHDMCPGCHTDSHAEANLIKTRANLEGADIYMYGHFWCCKSCWQKMKAAGVNDVYLPEDNMKFDTKEGTRAWREEYENLKK